MNRREVLASVGAASLLPAVAAFAVPAATKSPPAFEARLRIGPAQAGAGNHRWAPVLGGEMPSGRVLAGRMDWHVDPASGAVEAAVACTVMPEHGQPAQMHHAGLQAVRLPDGMVQLTTTCA